MGDKQLAAGLEARLRRLEDRIEINDLIARYGLVMDNRDMSGMPDLFTGDVVISSSDGGMNAIGRDAAVEMYRRRIKGLGPSNHFTHDRIVTFDEATSDVATGIVLSHSEMNLRGAAMLAAIRYADVYRREEGRWRFAARALSFLYFLRADEFAEALGPGVAGRNRVYGDRRPADWPESLPSWKEFYGE
jgi:ketosteroid isomerase-like protein